MPFFLSEPDALHRAATHRRPCRSSGPNRRGPWQNVVAMLRYGDSGMIRAAGQPDDEPAALAEFRDILATGFFKPDAN